MRIIEIEVNKIRGIHHILLKPNGKNFIIHGPNGSGKSAVVDAIDFLLTGGMSRLSGDGTAGITLSKHGKHVDSNIKDSFVRALIKLECMDEIIEIKRSLLTPAVLEYDPKYRAVITPILEFANGNQHLLTRKNLLKFVTSEAKSRALEIQNLLNLQNIEEIRNALTKSSNLLNSERKNINENLKREEVNITVTVQIKNFDKHLVLESINALRKTLDGEAISELDYKQLKKNLKSPGLSTKTQNIDRELLKTTLIELSRLENIEDKKNINDVFITFLKLLKDIKSDPDTLKMLSKLALYQLGQNLMREDGKCPLCDTSFEPGKLLNHISKQIGTLKDLQLKITKIEEQVKFLDEIILKHISKIQIVIDAAIKLEFKNTKELESWNKNLNSLGLIFKNPISKLVEIPISDDELDKFYPNDNILKILKDFGSLIESELPTQTPDQQAWDRLTTLEVNLKNWQEINTQSEKSEKSYIRSLHLLESFQKSRDGVLEGLYNQIRDRFVDLYKQIHKTEEDNFEAEIKPDGAGVHLRVGFHGRDYHPPHALHSEGHQDSMGLCLYLALAERLTKNKMNLIILDDVVMSIDSDHRKSICELIVENFQDRQFLITTHDKVWFRQLKNSGVVDRDGMVEFFNWKIDTGPGVTLQADIWDKINEDLKKDDIVAAAAKLRNYSEQFFGEACNNLQSQIRYSPNAEWGFSELIASSTCEYKDLLRAAKASAQSWGKKEEFDELQVRDSERRQAYLQLKIEEGMVNPSIHFNDWNNSTKTDFQPVVEKFQNLCGLFICPDCSGMVKLIARNLIKELVKCSCGRINWNLIRQPNAKSN